ncbi:hypothetical protein IEQ34_000181 [Dendrobium chrysotoxum]|uniref:C2H2-type domain-containing protein n=1 Tax=Dendrobium chrysotoxum TaxID=161865 RepID=A0AAV7HQT9_DENCH|nr:hypothetical protein IEQ34_000181 [Dendrobium chrysotoxum]
MQTDSPNGEVDPGGAATATMTAFAGGNSSSHIRSYECNFCKRGFLNAQALGGHMNIHRRDRVNKTLMKPGTYNYQSNIPQYFGISDYDSASSSKGNIDMKKRREDDDGVNEREKRKLDMEAGELDLELRLWSDGTARNKDSTRLKDFF